MTTAAGAVAAVVALLVWTASQRAVREVLPSAADAANAARLVSVRPVEGKGLGVVATRALPRDTFIAPYPGFVRTAAQYDRLLRRGRVDDEYAAEFWHSAPGGAIDETYIINPKLDGRMAARFGGVGPYINEPARGARPNVMWVWNFPRRRLEFWTRRRVAAGEELTVCYGAGYRRGYSTECEEEGVEIPRMAIASDVQAKPRPWYSVVPDDRDPRL